MTSTVMGCLTEGAVGVQVWYAVGVRSSVSIALFLLLSGFFLFVFLAALERSRKALAVASVCLVGVVCIIVFLTPVQLPGWIPINEKDGYYRYEGGTESGATTTTEADAPIGVDTTIAPGTGGVGL